jgi:hypothetical protein
MADKKISQLTAATTPLAGTEVLPIVQSGSTVKVAVSDLTAGRATSMTGATITGLTASKPVFTDGSKALTSSGTVPTDQGGTGLTAFVANTVPYASSTSALSASGALRYNGTNLGVGSTDYGNAGSINVAVGVPGTTAGGLQLWCTTSGTHFIQFGDGTTGDQVYRGYISYAHGTDTLELGAAGTTKASVTSAGNLSIANGNLVVGTAAKGIDFSANTHAAGMTSELLNWYEEGTWTPQVYYQNATDQGNATDVTQVGHYTRVGNVVVANCYLTWTITGTPANDNVGIKNLPFTIKNSANYYPIAGAILGNADTNPTYGGWMVQGQPNTKVAIIFTGVNGDNQGNEVGTAGTKSLFFTLSYLV